MKRERVVLAGHRLVKLYSFDSVSNLVRAECKCGWEGSFRHTQRGRDAYREHLLFEKKKQLEENCPEGYTILIPGQTVNMLGAKELWLIHSNNPEPFLTRIPQDYVDYGDGKVLARRPKEWGHPLYYKVVCD